MPPGRSDFWQVWHWKMVLVLGTLFCILTGNEILADLPDREGDAAQRRVTVARISHRGSSRAAGDADDGGRAEGSGSES